MYRTFLIFYMSHISHFQYVAHCSFYICRTLPIFQFYMPCQARQLCGGAWCGQVILNRWVHHFLSDRAVNFYVPRISHFLYVPRISHFLYVAHFSFSICRTLLIFLCRTLPIFQFLYAKPGPLTMWRRLVWSGDPKPLSSSLFVWSNRQLLCTAHFSFFICRAFLIFYMSHIAHFLYVAHCSFFSFYMPCQARQLCTVAWCGQVDPKPASSPLFVWSNRQLLCTAHFSFSRCRTLLIFYMSHVAHFSVFICNAKPASYVAALGVGRWS